MARIGAKLGVGLALVAVPLALLAAQLPTPDKLPATGGDITIAPINHATLQLTFAGKVIEVDPVAAAGTFAGFAAPDVILITDIHGDHLDPATINKRKKATTTIVAPQAAVAQLTAAQIANPVVMSNGDKKTVAGIEIEAVPMYNLKRGPSGGTALPRQRPRQRLRADDRRQADLHRGRHGRRARDARAQEHRRRVHSDEPAVHDAARPKRPTR